jgi:thermitase
MRQPVVLVLAFTLLVPSLAMPGIGAPARRPAADEFVPDEVLVAFRRGANAAAVARAAGGHAARRLEGLDVHKLKVPAGAVEAVVAALEHHPLVEFAEPNAYLHTVLAPSDPYGQVACYSTSRGPCVSQWGWARVSAYEAWDVTTGSAAVRVAVVDTGIDVGNPTYSVPDATGHEDIVSCHAPIIASFVSGESGNDDNGHGTHVAGTIGACTDNGTGVSGANWAVQLMGAKVLDYSGAGTLWDVAAGIRWAADNGAKVINLSLGTRWPLATLERAVDYAWSKGAVLACAAGNGGTSSQIYPAAYTNCIAVAATDENDLRTSFSSYGADWVDVAAPGIGILSTLQDDFNWCFLCYGYGYNPQYDALSGTSMATPHVAGLAALIWARGLCATNTCVRNAIEATADPVPSTGVNWKWGRVNYYNAVK